MPHKHKLVFWKKGYPLRMCKCGYMDGIYPKIGKNSIDVGAAGAGDVIRWSATQAALQAGDLGMSASSAESANGRPSAFIQGDAHDLIAVEGVRGGGRSRVVTIQQNANLTTLSNIGLATVPVVSGTPTVTDVNTGEGQFINYASGAVAGNQGGIVPSTFDQTMRNFRPIVDIAMRMPPAPITNIRMWSGIFSADPMGSATPAVHLMGFRYDTAVDGTTWRAVTDNASGVPTVTDTTVTVAVTTSYRLRILVDNAGTTVRFYINGILRATHTTTLPTSTQNLGYCLKVQTLDAVAKAFRFGRLNIAQRASA